MTSISTLSFGLVLATLLAGSAHAAETPTDLPGLTVTAANARIVEPIYAKHPRNYRVYGGPGPYFPERATRLKVSGEVVLQCRLLASGLLEACAVVSESPADFGFGDASLLMAKREAVTARPLVVEGQPVDGESVRLTIPFNAPARGY